MTKTIERYRRCCYASRDNNDAEHDRQVLLEIPLQFPTSILGAVTVCSVHAFDRKKKKCLPFSLLIN